MTLYLTTLILSLMLLFIADTTVTFSPWSISCGRPWMVLWGVVVLVVWIGVVVGREIKSKKEKV